LAATLIELDEVGSTNDWLAAQPAVADGTWVRTDRQTGGRGRRGRAWTSIPGNLFISTLTRPQPGEGPSPQLSFVAALALDRAMQTWVPAERLSLKWPNDLLLDGIKVSGILLEGASGATIVGIGVNLAAHPADSERPATSLAAVGIAPPPAHDAAIALIEAFDALRATWRDHGFAAIRRAWLARASGLGALVEARLGNETLTGRFTDLDKDGALLLMLDDGSTRAIHAGEVFRL
jgi:BirA family transcriptional regulator, biotin operon repressor / biotin---[acetyl-CoA-carboxylase] ligase